MLKVGAEETTRTEPTVRFEICREPGTGLVDGVGEPGVGVGREAGVGPVVGFRVTRPSDCSATPASYWPPAATGLTAQGSARGEPMLVICRECRFRVRR
jgi:hypothetical protein